MNETSKNEGLASVLRMIVAIGFLTVFTTAAVNLFIINQNDKKEENLNENLQLIESNEKLLK